jgi:hypothetical protein
MRVCHVAHVRSCSDAAGIEESDEALSCGLIEDHLVPVPMRAGARVAASRPRERILEPGSSRLVVGVWLSLLLAGVRRTRDLGLERPDGPATIRRTPGQRASAMMVGFGKERLPVALRQCASVDQLDRLVGQIQ